VPGGLQGRRGGGSRPVGQRSAPHEPGPQRQVLRVAPHL